MLLFLLWPCSSDPMRISKKFAGASCIGKQVFQPIDVVNDGYAHELDELDMLRLLFHRRVCEGTGIIPLACLGTVKIGRASNAKNAKFPSSTIEQVKIPSQVLRLRGGTNVKSAAKGGNPTNNDNNNNNSNGSG